MLFFMALCIGLGSVMAQTDKEAAKAAKKAEKEAKKEAKKAENAARIKEAMATGTEVFAEALKALDNRHFVLEADRVEFKRGRFADVTASTNFVVMNGDKASIQLSLNGLMRGPNGMGGVTVDGSASSVELTVDKKGNVSFEMSVHGSGVSARLYLRMSKDTNRCTVTVSPNFSSNRISFMGHLLPPEKSLIFKGRSI